MLAEIGKRLQLCFIEFFDHAGIRLLDRRAFNNSSPCRSKLSSNRAIFGIEHHLLFRFGGAFTPPLAKIAGMNR
jgi:hypothetical protein